MNLKISVILLYIFTTMVSIRQLSASNIDTNETQSKIGKISTITTASTIVSETCNDRFCYGPLNETVNNVQAIAPSYKEYDRLKSTSILYGIVKIASERPQVNKCYRELQQIYDGIHRKEIWAIKGK